MDKNVTEHLLGYLDRLVEMISSRRFQAFVAGVAVIIYHTQLGLTEAQVTDIRNLLIAWILATSYRGENDPVTPTVVSGTTVVAPPLVRTGFGGPPYGTR